MCGNRLKNAGQVAVTVWFSMNILFYCAAKCLKGRLAIAFYLLRIRKAKEKPCRPRFFF